MRAFLTQWFGRDPSSRIQSAARDHARSRLSDIDACTALAAEISGLPAGAIEAEIARWPPRDDFVNDRAFRLLVGVRDGVVPAIDGNCREQFAREEELGRLPLPEAFGRLAATCPELTDLANRARAKEKPHIRELRPVLTELDHEYGSVAFYIVTRYLADCGRGRTDQTPLFDRSGLYQRHIRLGPA
jgi:hypothetical protein